jgi:hypothetical protein
MLKYFSLLGNRIHSRTGGARMPHSHNIDYYLGTMDDESLADALADFEDPLEGRSMDFLSSLDEDDFRDDDFGLDYEDY